jgi:hypothetical protein
VSTGGGERYIFSVISSLQRMGYWVDVITTNINTCRSKDALLLVAEELRVNLRPHRLSYTILKDSYLGDFPGKYDVFFALGNEKVSA